MGAAASVAHKYERQCVHQYQDILENASRRGLNREQRRRMLQELRQRHLQLLATCHQIAARTKQAVQPIIDTCEPIYGKYQPIVKKYVYVGMHQTKMVYRRVDDAVTTVALQALYQARRQMVSQLSDASLSSYFDIRMGE